MPQRATRIYMQAIARAWSTLTTPQHMSWLTHPGANRLRPYHCYLSENANRYKNLDGQRYGHALQHNYPTAQWPATLAGENTHYTGPTVTNLSRSINFAFYIWTVKDSWLFTFHYGNFGTTWPIYTTLVYVFQPTSTGQQEITIADLPPGAAMLRVVRTTTTGKTEDTSWNYNINPLP